MRIDEILPEALPPDVVAAFTELGHEQRGAPERAMLRVQKAMGGGVLSVVVEHAGDLIHRMSHMAQYNQPGTEYVLDKAEKVLRRLQHRYGFEREMQENIINNAQHDGVPETRFRQRLDAALTSYAETHRALPVYNRAQWLARAACVAIGLQRFNRAIPYLKQLQRLAASPNFAEYAFAFTRTPEGTLKHW